MKMHSSSFPFRSLVLIVLGAMGQIASTSQSMANAQATSEGLHPSSTSSFNLGWHFHRGDVVGAENPDYDDRSWRIVDLPHDWGIEAPEGSAPGADPHDRDTPLGANAGYLHGGTGWYRNAFTVSPVDAGKFVDIIFDGAQQEADVWINGRYLGFQPHGYVAFHYDLTPYLNAPGKKNMIAVRTINPERNSRWYTGSGLYRQVSLHFHDPLHIPVWGMHIDTLRLSPEQAELQVKVAVRNARKGPERFEANLKLTGPSGETLEFDLGQLQADAGSTEQLSQEIAVPAPRTWSAETPNLYHAEVRVIQDGHVVDSCIQGFGIRTVSCSAEKGFLLNGRPVKLKGGCVHADNGLLGAAAFGAAEDRRVALMKRNGFNAIRTSHNPPSSAFLDACDRLGLLVIDEFTDVWEIPKTINGYNRYFEKHWERDLMSMLARDFNHPSVVMWSIGNEIPERARPAGVEIGQDLVACVRGVDTRRPVTNAICGFWDDPEWDGQWDRSAPAFGVIDVGGYNYHGANYESDHVKFPSRIMVGTESFAKDAYEYWTLVERLPYVIGDFVWTGIDYRGESGLANSVYVDDAASVPGPPGLMPWPTSISWSGDLDITGDKKPQSFYRDVVWDRSKIEVAVHAPLPPGKREIVSQWGWPNELQTWSWAGCQGQALLVNVYSKAHRVRLELNGRILGERVIDLEKGITATFHVPYEPGVLSASALEADKVVATCTLRSSGPAASIALLPEPSGQSADRAQLIFVPIEIRDASGAVVSNANVTLELALAGPAQVQAFGSANPEALGPFNASRTETFRGRALAILRPTGEAGTVHLNARAPGLPAAEIDIPLPAR